MRRGTTAIGLGFVPVSAQGALEDFIGSSGGDAAMDLLREALRLAGVEEQLFERHVPILSFAREKKYPLLALSPDPEIMATLAKGGLQSLDPLQRDRYVVDAEGFIGLTRDPRFQLYAEKSLFKDFVPSGAALSDGAIKVEQGNFFAERILVHEAAATAVSKWAVARPGSMVISVSPIKDVRFMGGMNGRVPRIYQFLKSDGTNVGRTVTEDDVTTILLNPSPRVSPVTFTNGPKLADDSKPRITLPALFRKHSRKADSSVSK